MKSTIIDRMKAVEKLAIQDDDGKWDPTEIEMLALAARARDSDGYDQAGVTFMVDLHNNSPATAWKGDARNRLVDVLVGRMAIEPTRLNGVKPPPVELTYQKNGSNKFYRLEITGSDLLISYGKIGTSGQTQTKSFPDEAQAIKEYQKRLGEKLAEGYEKSGPPAQGVTKPATTKVAYTEMSWHEVEDLIEKVYGQSYDIVPSEEWGNDSQHSFKVDGKVDDPDRIEEFKKGESPQYALSDLLNDMARLGKLEKGSYLITVCW